MEMYKRNKLFVVIKFIKVFRHRLLVKNLFAPGKWQCKGPVCSGSGEIILIIGSQPRTMKDLCCLQHFFGI